MPGRQPPARVGGVDSPHIPDLPTLHVGHCHQAAAPGPDRTPRLGRHHHEPVRAVGCHPVMLTVLARASKPRKSTLATHESGHPPREIYEKQLRESPSRPSRLARNRKDPTKKITMNDASRPVHNRRPSAGTESALPNRLSDRTA